MPLQVKRTLSFAETSRRLIMMIIIIIIMKRICRDVVAQFIIIITRLRYHYHLQRRGDTSTCDGVSWQFLMVGSAKAQEQGMRVGGTLFPFSLSQKFESGRCLPYFFSFLSFSKVSVQCALFQCSCPFVLFQPVLKYI